MKFYKFKQVQRLVFFGHDDVLRFNPGSLSKRSKQTTSELVENDTKRLKFNFLGRNGVQLLNNARIVIESLFIPPSLSGMRQGPITIRANNLNGDMFDSIDNNLNSPLLFTSEDYGTFRNPSPKMLYNYNVSQSFFQNGYLELEITYPNVGIAVNSFESFQISLIVYDINEEELVLKDTAEVDYKNMRSHLPTDLGMLGVVPNDNSRYKTKKK
jgi:hypothetical protein